MKTQTLIIFVFLLAVVGGGLYFLIAPVSIQNTSLPLAISNTRTIEVKTITVEGKPFEFTPKEIRVNQGDRVRIIFTNLEGMHDWVLDEFNVRTSQISTGQSETIEFVADKTGTFEYYCSVGSHRQMGMVGKLIVQ